jgi:outer membrane receptor protein involved in Fe transport
LKPNYALSSAIIAALSVHAAAAYGQQAAPGAAGSDSIAEVIVTAQRRSESAQNVPITIQALTAETLTQLNVSTFDDVIKYLPNVTAAGGGPGQSQLIIRGLATSEAGNQGSGTTGSFPNVAVYLDDQSAQLPGRNLDIYAADLERVEVLEGPQGTLFGAGAQAGVIRYITNKPKLDVTEGSVNAGYAATAHGDPSSSADAMINLPIIPDTLAVRGVIYDDSRGGYINNIPATFSRSLSDRGIHYATSTGVLPPSETINNYNVTGNAINPVTYQGMRLSALWKINDDWNALVTQSYQSMDAEGVFAEEQYNSSGVSQPDLSVQLYNPSWDKDRFENTSWTLNGHLDQLKLVYTGGYLVRHVEQVQDYTNYARGTYADYYQCLQNVRCYSPSATWHELESNTHLSHELRISTPDDWRLRAIGGLYWEQYTIHDTVDWYYRSPDMPFGDLSPPTQFCVNAQGQPTQYGEGTCIPYPVTSNNPNTRNANDSFADDVTRGYTQRAAFLSVDYDLIPKTLTMTLGTRYFRIESREVGWDAGTFGCLGNPAVPQAQQPPCQNDDNYTNLDARHLDNVASGFKSRANLTWHISGDAMVYYTWSQGFRPGGFNRGNAVVSGGPLAGQWTDPLNYASDELTNNEFGWKTQWFDHRLQLNGTLYREDWKNTQVEIFDPGLLGDLDFVTNGANYVVKGAELQLVARVTHALTVTGAAAWNSSNLVSVPQLIGGNGQPINLTPYGTPQNPSGSPFGAVGSPLAQSPPFEANLRVRYDFALGEYEAFWQVSGTHQDHSFATTNSLQTDLQGNSINYELPAFSTMDASAGLSMGAWAMQAYATNLTDTRGELSANYSQWYKAVTVNRPRTMGLKFSFKFGGGK